MSSKNLFVAAGAVCALVAASAAPAFAASLIGGLSLVANPEPGVVGQESVLKVTVPVPDYVTSGGEVTFISAEGLTKTVEMAPDTGSVTLPVIPQEAGTYEVTATFTPALEGGSDMTVVEQFVVDKAPTRMNLRSPNTVLPKEKVQFVVSVASPGSVMPTGEVEVSYDGTVIASGDLDSYGVATIPWTVPSAAKSGEHVITATYAGDKGHEPASSEKVTVDVPTKADVVLQSLSNVTVATPTTIYATVDPMTATGKVSFYDDGVLIGAPASVVSGKASVRWTPTKAGQRVIKATFTPTDGEATSTEQEVKVASSSTPDTITVKAGTATWSKTGTQKLTQGTPISLSFTTKSGTKPTASVSGPCDLSAANVLSTDATTGSCTLTVKSEGSDLYTSVTDEYRMTIAAASTTPTTSPSTTPQNTSTPIASPKTVAQTAKLPAAPKKVKVGAKGAQLLAAKSAKTDEGQVITWKVTKGAKVCTVKGKKMADPSAKNSKKLVPSWVVVGSKPGTCTLTASAEGSSKLEPYSKTMTVKVVK